MDDVASQAHAALAARDWATVHLLLRPDLHWTDTEGHVLRGRSNVLAMLQHVDAVDLPASVELRDGQIYRWVEAAPVPDRRST